MRKLAALLLALIVAAPAHAEWMQSSSAHFVVFADDSERDIRTFSEKLERYHAALDFVTGNRSVPPSPSNRVTVYVVRNAQEVRKLYGEGSQNLGGFYIPRAGGSLAIVPQIRGANARELDFSMTVLLHEYAHHFMHSVSSNALPRWVSEGGAEFFASAQFETDGSVWVGRPANHRAAEIYYARDVNASDLVDPEAYEKRRTGTFDAFYGKSWLLYHYLAFEPTRAGQMKRYLEAMAGGKSSREAAIDVFGDLDKLERDLESYLNRQRVLAFKLPPRLLTIGAIELRRLSVGEAAIMPVMIRSRRGVDAKQAEALVVEARAVAVRFPTDAAVQAALAEAEYDAGNDAQAIVAADAAIAADPRQANAYVQKGYALFRIAEAAPDRLVAYRRARAPFVALNRLENDHPLPLFYFFQSQVRQGDAPSQLAKDGLMRAVELAPFDFGMRMTLADVQLRDGKREDARRTLAPVAYNPHGGSLARVAQRAIARIDSDKAWTGRDGLNSFGQSATTGTDETK